MSLFTVGGKEYHKTTLKVLTLIKMIVKFNAIDLKIQKLISRKHLALSKNLNGNST